MKFYLDESVSVALAVVLTQHGFDRLTARDAGNLGVTDEEQLAYAASAERILFTHDTRDFLRPANAWEESSRSHAGILLAHQAPLRELTRRFRALLLNRPAVDLTNQVM